MVGSTNTANNQINANYTDYIYKDQDPTMHWPKLVCMVVLTVVVILVGCTIYESNQYEKYMKSRRTHQRELVPEFKKQKHCSIPYYHNSEPTEKADVKFDKSYNFTCNPTSTSEDRTTLFVVTYYNKRDERTHLTYVAPSRIGLIWINVTCSEEQDYDFYGTSRGRVKALGEDYFRLGEIYCWTVLSSGFHMGKQIEHIVVDWTPQIAD